MLAAPQFLGGCSPALWPPSLALSCGNLPGSPPHRCPLKRTTLPAAGDYILGSGTLVSRRDTSLELQAWRGSGRRWGKGPWAFGC